MQSYRPKQKISVDWFPEDSKRIAKDYICFFCSGVFCQPHGNPDKCAHIFCKDCIMNSNLDKCPQCLEEQNTETNLVYSRIVPIIFLQNLLNRQTINCKNSEAECTWSGPLSDLDHHLTQCLKEKLKCENKGCEVTYIREAKERHEVECEYRLISCEKCEGKIILSDLTSHFDECPKALVVCPNRCEVQVERHKIETHMNFTCGNVKINCDYSNFGCKFKCLRKEMDTHLIENAFEHNILVLNSNSEICNKIETQSEYLDKRMNEIIEVAEIFQRRIENIKKVIREEKDIKLINKKHRRNNGVKESNIKEMSIKEATSREGVVKEVASVDPLVKETFSKSGFESFSNIAANGELQFTFSNYGECSLTNGLSIDPEGKITLTSCDPFNPHQFIIIDKKLNTLERENMMIDTEESFKFKIEAKFYSGNIEQQWLAFGVCIKEVLLNDLSYFESSPHGMFTVSTDGILCHNNSTFKNNTRLPNFPASVISSSNEFSAEIAYDHFKKELRVSIKDDIWKIPKVFALNKNSTIVPCVVMKNQYDEVKIFY